MKPEKKKLYARLKPKYKGIKRVIAYVPKSSPDYVYCVVEAEYRTTVSCVAKRHVDRKEIHKILRRIESDMYWKTMAEAAETAASLDPTQAMVESLMESATEQPMVYCPNCWSHQRGGERCLKCEGKTIPIKER